MEEAYAEAGVKRKTTPATILIKTVLIIVVAFVFVLTLYSRWLMVLGVAAAVVLIWYWPRFNIEWEYIYTDGQLDFDQILGGEKRKNILRIEIEQADVIAPIDSSRLDGYRHLASRNFTSLEDSGRIYGVATKIADKEDKELILFEPSEKMLDIMHAKCPNIVTK